MRQVNSWKDWLLWPLRTHFETQVNEPGVGAASDLGSLVLANTINRVRLDKLEDGDEHFSVAIVTPEGDVQSHTLPLNPQKRDAAKPQVVAMPRPAGR